MFTKIGDSKCPHEDILKRLKRESLRKSFSKLRVYESLLCGLVNDQTFYVFACEIVFV